MSEEKKKVVIGTLKRLHRPCTTLDLAKGLGMNRKEANVLLYAFQKEGLIKKVQESNPPMWDLTPSGQLYGTRMANVGRGRGRGLLGLSVPTSSSPVGMDSWTSQVADHPPSPGKKLEGLQEKIVQLLDGVNKSMSALEIAHAVGLKVRREVNPDLYALQKKGLVSMQHDQGPPVWRSAGGHQQTSSQQSLQQPHLSSQPPLQQSSHPPSHQPLQQSSHIPSHPLGRGRGLSILTGERPDRFPSSNPSSSRYMTDPPGSTDSDVDCQILQVLERSSLPWQTDLEIRNAVGVSLTRAEGRSVLERLESEGKVKRKSGMPVQWSLTSDTPPVVPENNAAYRIEPIGKPALTSSAGYSMGVASTSPGSLRPSTADTAISARPLSADSGFSASSVNEMNRNPISALLEFCQAKKIEQSFVDVREYGPPHRKHFVVAVQLGKEMCEPAESTTRKEARRMAADLALQYVQQKYGHTHSSCSLPAHPILAGAPLSSEATGTGSSGSASFSDHIARLVHDHFQAVQATLDYPQPGRKVIAGFVMEDSESGFMKVVSLGSGTRCITGDHMSMEGTAVNDCHAEVIARRSLMRFFYKELHAYFNSGSSGSIFQAPTRDSTVLSVKPNLKFHLYISTAPCGDGAQFSRDDSTNRDPPSENLHVPTMQGNKQGNLRTKIEGGEGTIPVGVDQSQLTWDGVLRGERLRTMSCSDKVGRWNVLGLQGALLSFFVRPVYMASLTLGSLHHHGHLSRAVCCRFGDVGDKLPPSYCVNHPQLGRVRGGNEMKRHTEKTSNYSMNWALGDAKGELLDGGNGRLVGPPGIRHAQSTVPSRVAKIAMYHEFVELTKAIGREELVRLGSYKEAKEMAAGFQQAKNALFETCLSKGYGRWMKKPDEEEAFGRDVLARFYS